MINQTGDLKISEALGRIAPSATVALTQEVARLRAEGRKIIGLGAGEPDFETPEHIKDAAIAAIRDGKTRYTPPGGIAELKEAIVEKFAVENGISYAPENVVVSTGGKQVLFNALLATLNSGDEVIVPAPYWVSYPDIVRFAGGCPVIVPCSAEDGYKIGPDALEAAITTATRWLILNSPNNPTGAVYTREEIGALASVLDRHPHVMVLSDEIYEHISYLGTPSSIASYPGMRDRTVVVNGVSKAYAMTGWRIGFGAGPEALIAAMVKLQGQSTTNACTISQWAAVAALNGPKAFLKDWNARYMARRDIVANGFGDLDGTNLTEPDGAFYAFPNVAELLGRQMEGGAALVDDVSLAAEFLKQENVALVPGTAFGAPGHLRISFATDEQSLFTASARFARFSSRIR